MGQIKYKDIEKEVVRLYENEYSIDSISKKLFIKQSTVYYLLRKNDIAIAKGLFVKEEQWKKIKADCNKGLSFDILANKYKIEKTRLCRMLNSTEISDIKKQMIVVLARKGNYVPSHIAQKLSITTKAVKQVIKDFGIEKRKNLLQKVGITKQEILNLRNKIIRDNIDDIRI